MEERRDPPRRVLLKVSGESLGTSAGLGIDPAALERMAEELVAASRLGAQVAVVVGGGNFLRGQELAHVGMERASADFMGMLATVMNGLALQSVLAARGAAARLLSAVEVRNVVEPYSLARCRAHLAEGALVILAGGTGNPYFSTDTCAALRAIEIGADVLLKGTKVDGVFDKDPLADAAAERFEVISYDQVLARRLGIMDSTAIALCREHRMPIRVFNMFAAGNIRRGIVEGGVGTRICAADDELTPSRGGA